MILLSRLFTGSMKKQKKTKKEGNWKRELM